MKRALGSLLIGIAAVSALAQSSFTIVRPADGSRVRENIRLLFPMNSIPDTGYVGIYIGGKFVEALVPPKGANYRYYDIDTKARGIQDGPLTIEAVLFVDFADKPRIVDRSEIQVTVANSANIDIPDAGFKLAYKFRPGTEWVYNLRQKVAVSNLSETMANSTSRQSLLAGADVENIRLLYAVDNTYAGGDGLVRIQALPEKGKRTLSLTTEDSDSARTFEDYQVHPIYMRLNSIGQQVFGSVPRYFPLEGTAGEGFRTDLFVPYPLPTLPSATVRAGGLYPAKFQLGDLDLSKIDDLNSLVTDIEPVRGEFVGVEWQNGHPCVRLRHSLSGRDPRGASETQQSRVRGAQSIEEDIWFALDLGTVVKMVRTYTIDARIAAPTTAAAGGGAAGGGATAGGGRAGSAGGGSGAVANWRIPDIIRRELRQFGGDAPRSGGAGAGGQGRGGGRQEGGGPVAGGAGGAGGGAAAGGGRSGGSAGTRIVRITVEQVFELEK